MAGVLTPCREYAGYKDHLGYGRRSGKAGRRFGTHLVHRQIMIMVGHDIAGKVVMHLCDNPACFRYDHLVIATQADNLADMRDKGRWTNKQARQTHCPQGHLYDEANTYVRRGTLWRACRACARQRARIQRAV